MKRILSLRRTFAYLALASLVCVASHADEPAPVSDTVRAGAVELDDCDCGGTEAGASAVAKRSGERRTLVIGADPNNLPFSNDKGEGFENEIARLIAKDLGLEIEYRWRAQRRGFFRESLKEGDCDLVLGAPSRFEMVLTTKSYYRSAYAIVTRTDRDLDIRSLKDERLKSLKIGIQLAGDDGVNPPPAHALAALGIVDNVVGFTLYGDYGEPNPPSALIRAVADEEIDVAIAWGPLAGYFAPRQTVPLTVTSLTDADAPKPLRFEFDIAMGVRKGDDEFRNRIDDVLRRRSADIDEILRRYNIPLVSAGR